MADASAATPHSDAAEAHVAAAAFAAAMSKKKRRKKSRTVDTVLSPPASEAGTTATDVAHPSNPPVDLQSQAADAHKPLTVAEAAAAAAIAASKRKKKKKGKSLPTSLEYHTDDHQHMHRHDIGPGGDGTKSHDDIWYTSDAAERMRLRDFWLQLSEEDRSALVKLEKEAVLKNVREQQKRTCSCHVCGRKKMGLGDEFEMLYGAYYDELQQFSNEQATTDRPPRRHPHRTQYRRGDDLDDIEDDIDYEDEDHESEDSGILEFGTSLTVKEGILTVADDFLKNDGQKFLNLMEQLSQRRERPLEFEDEGPPLGPPNAGDYEDDDEDEEYDDEDEYEDDVEEGMTDQQRMEEGRRMFQIFAAKMFEQRVLAAYREKVAQERQKKFLEELEEEERQRELKDKAKQHTKEKKKAQKRAIQQKKEEDRRAMERQKLEREQEERRKREEQERQRLQAEKAKRDDALRLQYEAEEKVRRESEQKARREAKERAKREAEEKAKREAEEKAKREAEEKAKREAEKARKAEEKRKRRQSDEQTRKQRIADAAVSTASGSTPSSTSPVHVVPQAAAPTMTDASLPISTNASADPIVSGLPAAATPSPIPTPSAAPKNAASLAAHSPAFTEATSTADLVAEHDTAMGKQCGPPPGIMPDSQLRSTWPLHSTAPPTPSQNSTNRRIALASSGPASPATAWSSHNSFKIDSPMMPSLIVGSALGLSASPAPSSMPAPGLVRHQHQSPAIMGIQPQHHIAHAHLQYHPQMQAQYISQGHLEVPMLSSGAPGLSVTSSAAAGPVSQPRPAIVGNMNMLSGISTVPSNLAATAITSSPSGIPVGIHGPASASASAAIMSATTSVVSDNAAVATNLAGGVASPSGSNMTSLGRGISHIHASVSRSVSAGSHFGANPVAVAAASATTGVATSGAGGTSGKIWGSEQSLGAIGSPANAPIPRAGYAHEDVLVAASGFGLGGTGGDVFSKQVGRPAPIQRPVAGGMSTSPSANLMRLGGAPGRVPPVGTGSVGSIGCTVGHDGGASAATVGAQQNWSVGSNPVGPVAPTSVSSSTTQSTNTAQGVFEIGLGFDLSASFGPSVSDNTPTVDSHRYHLQQPHNHGVDNQRTTTVASLFSDEGGLSFNGEFRREFDGILHSQLQSSSSSSVMHPLSNTQVSMSTTSPALSATVSTPFEMPTLSTGALRTAVDPISGFASGLSGMPVSGAPISTATVSASGGVSAVGPAGLRPNSVGMDFMLHARQPVSSQSQMLQQQQQSQQKQQQPPRQPQQQPLHHPHHPRVHPIQQRMSSVGSHDLAFFNESMSDGKTLRPSVRQLDHHMLGTHAFVGGRVSNVPGNPGGGVGHAPIASSGSRILSLSQQQQQLQHQQQQQLQHHQQQQLQHQQLQQLQNHHHSHYPNHHQHHRPHESPADAWLDTTSAFRTK